MKTTILNEKEGMVLHAVEKSIAYWEREIKKRAPYGFDESGREISLDALEQFKSLRDIILNNEPID